MVKFILIQVLLFCVLLSSAQVDKFVVECGNVRIMNNGDAIPKDTSCTNIITLDYGASSVKVRSSSKEVMRFLDERTEFDISMSMQSNGIIYSFLTGEDIFFAFDKANNLLQVTTKKMSPGDHSIWFEDIKLN